MTETREPLGTEARPNPDQNRPDPEWKRGTCPLCGDDVVCNSYYVGGRGYIIVWECWSSLQLPATCNFRRVI